MIFDVEVAVVGAGPTGLMLAGDLARAGVSCAVFERHSRRSDLTRAFAVQARTLEQLDSRGVADRLVTSGTPVSGLRLFADAELDLSCLPSRFPYLLVTAQYETERALEERARPLGAEIRYDAEVTGLVQQPDGVELTVREGGRPARVVRAGYVVGADGMHSTVRKAVGMPFPGKPVVRSVMLADVRLSEPPPHVLTVNTTGQAFAIIAPFGDGWYRVVAWHRHHQAPEDSPLGIDEVADVARQALGADYGIHDPRWLARFHSEERQVPRYRRGRVLLAGDAAHVHSPAGGQGMNTGLQDAANLGWKLAATVYGWAPPGLLDTYHAERHPVGRRVLRGSGALLRIALTGPPGLASARKLVARAATETPFVAHRLAGAISGISISYPAARDAHPLTGARAADLPLADGSRLYEALRDGRFLLAVDPATDPADAMSGYGDRVELVTRARAAGTVALVRPDAYIAWAGDSTADQTGTARIRGALARSCGEPALLQSAV